MLEDLTLNSPLAVVITIIAVAAGNFYRKAWLREGPRWQLWLCGLVAAAALMALALIPLSV